MKYSQVDTANETNKLNHKYPEMVNGAGVAVVLA